MKLVIFGANGPVGRILTTQALTEGHEVAAVTRHADAFPISHVRLRLLSGDVYKPEDVVQAVAGQEAVISLLGVPYTRHPVTVYSVGTKNILEAMHVTGVSRFVGVTAGGTNPRFDWSEGIIFGLLIKPIIGRTLYADMRLMEQIVMKSDLDWTIVRPARLVHSPHVTPYRTAEAFMVPGMKETARADLADFLLKEITNPRFSRKAVAVATDR